MLWFKGHSHSVSMYQMNISDHLKPIHLVERCICELKNKLLHYYSHNSPFCAMQMCYWDLFFLLKHFNK